MTDKEKEFRERIKCNIAYCEDTSNEQIEEMASDMDYGCTKRDLYPSDAKEIAKALYLLGYRKLPEDSVVISKEEYEEYKEFKAFMERNDWENIKDIETTLDKCQEVLYERLQQTSKKTAEKIIVDLIALAKQKQEEYKDMSYKSIGYNPNIGKSFSAEWYLFEQRLKNIVAPQFGVEIKES